MQSQSSLKLCDEFPHKKLLQTSGETNWHLRPITTHEKLFSKAVTVFTNLIEGNRVSVWIFLQKRGYDLHHLAPLSIHPPSMKDCMHVKLALVISSKREVKRAPAWTLLFCQAWLLQNDVAILLQKSRLFYSPPFWELFSWKLDLVSKIHI